LWKLIFNVSFVENKPYSNDSMEGGIEPSVIGKGKDRFSPRVFKGA
jgi:hypothetical protein